MKDWRILMAVSTKATKYDNLKRNTPAIHNKIWPLPHLMSRLNIYQWYIMATRRDSLTVCINNFIEQNTVLCYKELWGTDLQSLSLNLNTCPIHPQHHTLGHTLDLFQPQFPHLWNENGKSDLSNLLWGYKMLDKESLEECIIGT